MAHSICNWVFWIFLILYVTALFLFLIGTFGLFGQERDPLAAVFLVPLGLPWNQFLDALGDSARPWAAAASPALNLVILRLVCTRMSASA